MLIMLQLRILLWNTMLEKHVNKKDIADLLGVSSVIVNNMFLGNGSVSIELFEDALKALGKLPDVQI